MKKNLNDKNRYRSINIFLVVFLKGEIREIVRQVIIRVIMVKFFFRI